jgi:glycosyltransferase involved in cell wall biosynthesis
MRLAIISSHPIQYYAPLFRALTRRLDVHVFFAHSASPAQQAKAGFGTAFEWDVDLTAGYDHSFLRNVAKVPDATRFSGCDTPEIGERLREGGFDAVLCLGWHLKSMLQAVWAAKRLGLPVMVRGDSQLDTARSAPKRLIKACVYPIGLRAFDAALYVGARSKAYYRHYGYPQDQLIFSPHCVDNGWFKARATAGERAALRQERGIADDATVVLFAGKLVPFKRPLDIVAAAAQLRVDGTRVEMMVAGAGELEAELQREASACDVPLHLLGFQNQTRMPAAYATCDMLVLPSDGRETWGLVANEALACGRPIVVSDACGCAEDLAADGTVGQIFAVGDASALARAVGRTARAMPSASAIEAKSNRYSLDAAAGGIAAAVEICRRQPRRAAQVEC